jgi:hypothetical protein
MCQTSLTESGVHSWEFVDRRAPKKGFGRFVDMARGFVFECVAILRISLQRNRVDEGESSNLEGWIRRVIEDDERSEVFPGFIDHELRTTNYELMDSSEILYTVNVRSRGRIKEE